MSGKAVRETLAALGVIASLVFVGMEIRQNTAVARAQTRQWLTENHREWNLTLVSNADLNAAHDSVFTLEQMPGRIDVTRAYRVMFTNLRSLENVFLQVSEGVVDESVFQSYGWLDRAEFSTETFRSWWGRFRHRFHPDFVTAFEAEYDLAP